jgi:chromosomal replication initiator protein
LPERSPEAVWEAALGQLELQVTRPNFETWLRTTVGLRLDGDQFVVGVASDFCVEWLRSRMNPLINRTVSAIVGTPVSVSFQVLGAPSLAAPASPAVAPAGQHRPELNPALTFASFTVVKSNRLAYRAARKVASGDATYNPLVLSGPPGLGKTHLLHAIGHAALEAGRTVVALTTEAFVDRFASAVRRGAAHTFGELFHHCDLLLLDDLRFLATKSRSQEQFFHIFNKLHANGCVVVLTVDASLENIPGLSDALLSRLRAGLALELTPLTAEDRAQILKAKAARLAQPLPQPVIDLIAAQPYETVRELEGALNRAAAYADLSDTDLSSASVLRALYPLQAEPPAPSPEAILEVVARHFGVSRQQLASASRARDITYARHIAMYLLRSFASQPLTQIGQLLGGRDHTTVLHGYQRIEKERAALPETRDVLDTLEASLRGESAA